ncbi:DEAD-domain-containing protein, partial [Calocera cornea HHB12733]
QIISSLFTSNPSLPPSSAPAQSARREKPSNAPLADFTTFAGLGLSPLLVRHLRGKMGIDRPTAIQRATLQVMLSPSTSGAGAGAASDPSDPGASRAEERDIFIQSQTGSGKTLSYLLPIIQDLLPLSSASYIDRSIGTLAIVLAPTRELAKQIYDVLEMVLSLRLSAGTDEDGEGDLGPRLTRWLVPGLLTGGSTRTHEKARLRKGVPILVSTPGRLLDHLQTTSSFSCGKLRWLVLDEADRLMDLGFEPTIEGIVRALEGRRKLAVAAVREGKSGEVGGWDWARRRRTVLCSATMREDVQKLAGAALDRPVVVKGVTNADASAEEVDPLGVWRRLEGAEKEGGREEHFTPPAQLSQKYVVVPLKLRLVALVALLRSLLAKSGSEGKELKEGKEGKEGLKRIIVFLSCTDAVDFVWTLLGAASMSAGSQKDTEEEKGGVEDGAKDDDDEKKEKKEAELAHHSSLLPNAALYRLHGSLPLQTRLASLSGFTARTRAAKGAPAPEMTSSILFCTSVASRGLDLPRVQAVVQYDLPSEGGATEYVHRVGRTARVGRGGEAWAIVSPSEAAWVPWVEGKMAGSGETKSTLAQVAVEEVLQRGFGGRKGEWEQRATQVQLAFERWALGSKENAALARKAFASHIRAYATHPSEEKHLFHVRNLHLGHLAKSFALREAPSNLKG